MKVILFGATGMVGQGVLRECLLDAEVESVLAVGRSPTGQRHPKLREILHDNFLDYSAIESQLTAYDACFFCLGVSSIGLSEERYRRLTYDITLAAAATLARIMNSSISRCASTRCGMITRSTMPSDLSKILRSGISRSSGSRSSRAWRTER